MYTYANWDTRKFSLKTCDTIECVFAVCMAASDKLILRMSLSLVYLVSHVSLSESLLHSLDLHNSDINEIMIYLKYDSCCIH